MAGSDVKESATGRYMVSLDPGRAEPDAVARELGKLSLKVEERLDGINTMIVRGTVEQARKALKDMDAVTSVEAEEENSADR